MRIFIVDNYDSFTYNLVHYVASFDVDVVVKRNDEFKLEDLEPFDKIILSPGPGIPKNAGKLMEVIKTYYKVKPILGVCLGHQALGEFFGAKLYNMDDIYHGMPSNIEVNNNIPIFKDISSPTQVGRYHSWAINELPEELKSIAKTPDEVNMGFIHVDYPITALQFHPESIMTTYGLKMIENWIFQ